MKKNLWLAALVGVALTGCVSDESSPVDQQAQLLSFAKPVYNTQSRAVAGEITGDYSTSEDFKVFCRRYQGSFTGWLTSSGSVDFFGDEDAAVELSVAEQATHAEGATWKLEKDYYWPGTGYNLAFAAYSPADTKAASVSYAADGLTIIGFEPETTSDAQYDLMYSDRTIDCSNETHGKVSKPVAIKFRHALSSVVFAAVEEVEGRKYTVNGIKLVGNFAVKGDFKEQFNESPTEGQEVRTPIWKNLVKADRTYIPNITDVLITGTSNEFTAGTHALLLIPQNTIDEDAKVLLTYTVKPDNGVPTKYTDIEIPLNAFKTSSNASITEWKHNGRYVYMINFGGSNKISFTPSVEQWDETLYATYTLK